MQLYETASDDAMRVKCIGTLECLAQHPTSIDANRVRGFPSRDARERQ